MNLIYHLFFLRPSKQYIVDAVTKISDGRTDISQDDAVRLLADKNNLN